jgi:protein TonB
MAPRHIPRDIPKDDGAAFAPDSITPPGIGTGSYIGGESNFPVPIGGTREVIPPAPRIEKIFRTSTILQGMLIRKVEPKYPQPAMQARIQGPVVLAAVISKAGTIDNLRLISGHPMLVPAALDAVSQWRYRPFILNGDVIEVETQITVNFVLGR